MKRKIPQKKRDFFSSEKKGKESPKKQTKKAKAIKPKKDILKQSKPKKLSNPKKTKKQPVRQKKQVKKVKSRRSPLTAWSFKGIPKSVKVEKIKGKERYRANGKFISKERYEQIMDYKREEEIRQEFEKFTGDQAFKPFLRPDMTENQFWHSAIATLKEAMFERGYKIFVQLGNVQTAVSDTDSLDFFLFLDKVGNDFFERGTRTIKRKKTGKKKKRKESFPLLLPFQQNNKQGTIKIDFSDFINENKEQFSTEVDPVKLQERFNEYFFRNFKK